MLVFSPDGGEGVSSAILTVAEMRGSVSTKEPVLYGRNVDYYPNFAGQNALLDKTWMVKDPD